MIIVEKAVTESRPRDVKRNRVILYIGKLRFHLTEGEAFKLVEDIYKQTTRRL